MRVTKSAAAIMAVPLLLLVGLIALPPVHAADAVVGTPTWETWPPAQWPEAASDPRVQDILTHTNWTAEEKRNLQTTIEAFTDLAGQRGPKYRDPAEVNTRGGFKGLEDLYGAPGYDVKLSIADRKTVIEDIIAKGDRVWFIFLISGHHTGKMYGFPGTGKPIEIWEFGYLTFKNGRIIRSTFRAEELQIYEQLGGKTEFPKN